MIARRTRLMATRLLVAAAMLLGAAVLWGCARSPAYLSGEVVPTATAPANVHLHLSNQTSERGWDRVVLAVYVDGALTVRRSMKSVFANPNLAHGFPDEIPMRLAPGAHTIRVVAEGTTASAETQVVVGNAPLHVDAAFHYGTDCLREGGPRKASVTLRVSTERPGYC
jgi:hypothetical protein